MSAAGQRVVTPTARRVARRSLFWVGVALVALAVAVISLSVAGTSAGGPPLDPGDPGPGGGMAVAQVLREQGVTVTATSTLTDTVAAVDDPADTTLFLVDDGPYLDDEQLRRAVDLAAHVIVADPAFTALRAIAPELAQAGVVDGVLDADCDVPAVQRAGQVSASGTGYRIVDDRPGTLACLGSGDDVYSLVQRERDSGLLTVLGATGALSNELVASEGNAALALTLLGEHDELVWYTPTLADVPGEDTLGELTPAWVTPVLTLLVLTFVAAAVWRGRRFGPLVVENLPVTVKASETMIGRARLYERSSSRLRALDSLRIGAIQRLARLSGLPRVATVDEVVSTVAALTGAQVGDIRNLLIDADPVTDADLVALSDALITLERDATRAVHP